ncbi:TfuA-like protein [Ruegeria lacuscaerulensis]|uniref:TfuA-like protein n=1 Tax=Ruegeria lacuscaerulensis TaxID=55218 RepID=UPI00148171F7|nr:TfuA-like protein [Ruegeria lacuscaerulensis]
MSVVVFVGPTLPHERIAEYLEATILPPVRQGDVYRAARDRPNAIGIIDGYFEGVPSVWHKEILWAMEQGIPVFGSASMGALRAAELSDMGMIGVGQIFEDYRADVLQDDDEVAVLHGPAELGYPALSVPMVSVRATVAKAVADGLVSLANADEMLGVAKSIHYQQRSWESICQALSHLKGIADFQAWVQTGQVDAKAEDACAMLRQMAEHLARSTPSLENPIRMERTLVWKGLRARVDGETTYGHAVLDELRLNPQLFSRLRERAALSLLAQEADVRPGNSLDRDAVMRQMSLHRASVGLPRHSDLMRWLDDNDLSLDSYEAMLIDNTRIEGAIADRKNRIEVQLISELCRAGRYAEFRDRAKEKAALSLSTSQMANAERLSMVLWYFETILDRDIPDDFDSYAVSLGLPDRDALFDLIEAEFLFCHRTDSSSPSGA